MAMQPQQGYAPQQPAYAQPAYAQPGTQTGYAQAPGQPVGGYAVQQPQQVAQQAVMQSYAPQPLQAAGVSPFKVAACSACLRRRCLCAVLLVVLQNAMLPAGCVILSSLWAISTGGVLVRLCCRAGQPRPVCCGVTDVQI